MCARARVCECVACLRGIVVCARARERECFVCIREIAYACARASRVRESASAYAVALSCSCVFSRGCEVVCSLMLRVFGVGGGGFVRARRWCVVGASANAAADPTDYLVLQVTFLVFQVSAADPTDSGASSSLDLSATFNLVSQVSGRRAHRTPAPAPRTSSCRDAAAGSPPGSRTACRSSRLDEY